VTTYRPPLSVSIKHKDGSITRLGDDEGSAGRIPMDLEFGTVAPGGDKDCTFSLSWPIVEDRSHELSLIDSVRVYGAGGKNVWGGDSALAAQLPREHDQQQFVRVGALGGLYLMDFLKLPRLWVDRDLTGWTSAPSPAELKRLGDAGFTADGTGSVSGDNTNGYPALVLEMPTTFVSTAGVKTSIETWYRAAGSCDISSVYYDFETYDKGNGGANTLTGAGWTKILAVSSDEIFTAFDSASVAGSGTGTLTATGSRKFGVVQLYFNGASDNSSAPGIWRFVLRKLAVFGNTGLTKRGTAPDQGYYLSDIVTDIFTTWGQGRIKVGDGIVENTIIPPHFAYPHGVKGSEALSAVNNYSRWLYGVYDDEGFFRPPDPNRKTWTARLSEGAALSLEGDQVDTTFNGVIVSFTDVDGQQKTIGPADTGCDFTSELLVDVRPENPLTERGLVKHDDLNIPFVTNPDMAAQIGAVHMIESSIPKRRGQATIRSAMINNRPLYEVRAGDYLSFSDHPNPQPRLVIDTRYVYASNTLTVSLDSSSHKLDAIMESLLTDAISRGFR